MERREGAEIVKISKNIRAVLKKSQIIIESREFPSEKFIALTRVEFKKLMKNFPLIQKRIVDLNEQIENESSSDSSQASSSNNSDKSSDSDDNTSTIDSE